MSKKPNVVWVGFLVSVLVYGCGRQTEQRSVDLTVPVTVRTVGFDTMESTVIATGTLRPVKEAQIATEVEGLYYLVDTNGTGKLAEGSRVEMGQLIARLVNEELITNARIESRNLALSTARKTLKEQEVMFKRGLVTEKEVDDARRAAADAESNQKDSEIQIAKTQIRSPIGGFLTGVTDITEGTLVENRATLATVMDYDQVLVDLKIPNAYIVKIALKQKLRVENYAFPQRAFAGTITAVDPALDPTTRTFRVVGTVDNPDLLLRPGMFVKAEIITESHEDVVVIPRRYVLTRQNRKVVFLEEEGRAQMRNVVTGLEDRENVEITEGIEEGERLITSNYETLRARTKVRVTGEGVLGSN
tara:strand:- start:4882 stop:5961 length:1080 start_codon:yes stop_codon:yes gene_type:complete